MPSEIPSIAIIFAQFAAYHVDRCEAVAERLKGRFTVKAVEVATTSATYAWEPSGPMTTAEKQTLFPGRSFDSLGRVKRLWREYRALRRCRWVFMGLSYAELDVVLLACLLRLSGVRLVVLSDSKFDDHRRHWALEAAKALVLILYSSAIVAGRRHIQYFQFLGFTGRRRIIPGYDTIDIDRVRQESEQAGHGIDWSQRYFVFVGRFVAKKNLATLVRAYAAYSSAETASPRRLVLIGDGEQNGELRALAQDLGVADRISWLGFLPAEQVSQHLAGGLALCLISTEEQWGLVVNEALSVGLPVIASDAVGAADTLVRSGLNGYVVDAHDCEQISASMASLANDEAGWHRMSAHSSERAWLGDKARFADAIETICDPGSTPAARGVAALRAAVGLGPD